MLRYEDIGLQFPKCNELTPGIGVVYQYLERRGVTFDMIDQLGLHVVPARDLICAARGAPNKIDDPRLAVVFPHADPSGRTIDWWSARLIDCGLQGEVRGFQAAITIKAGKMFCPPQEPPHAYLVPTLDWTKLERGDKVYIHESCIKAIAGAQLDTWSVGLNGVRGWSSKKHLLGLVDELKSLPWKALDLQPIIVFDSNASDNWDVQHAISSLATKLYEVTGRRAKHILLPKSPNDEHWGFDDFVVRMGADAARSYLDSADDAPLIEIGEFEQLKLKLNSEVCVVRSLSRIAVQSTGTLMTRGSFTDVNYAHYVAEVDEKQVNVPRVWLMDERRAEVERLEYLPGRDEMVQGEFLNLWRGMGVEPQVGIVDRWLELLGKQVPNEALRRWMIQWFAYPLQNLGAKMNTFIHLYGPPGTGKNALLAPIMKIYGRNGVVIGKDQISSAFNSVYAARQFVNLDEIHGGNEAGAISITNRIKMLVTSEELTVNTKGVPEYTVRNHVNLVTTSNYSDSVKLDEGDRRACVVLFGRRDTNLPQTFFDEYFAWVDGGGSEALYDFFLGYDLSGFDPAGHAFMTEWKEMVTDATRGAMEKWVRDLWDDPDSVMPPLLQGAKVLTPEQLGAAYYPDEPGKNTPGLRNAIGQRMQDQGFKRTEQVKVDGAPKRFWIIRDKDADWTHADIRKAAMSNKAKF